MKQENEKLEAKVKLLTKELGLLRDLLLSHAAGPGGPTVHTMEADMSPGGGDARVPASVNSDGASLPDHEYATVPQESLKIQA